MSIFRIEISTASDFPTVDVQHLLFELVELLETKFGGARHAEIQFPISFFIEGVNGTLSFRSLEADEAPADTSDLDQFLDELNRRLNDDEENDR